MTRERLEALCRLLIESGDITPFGVRVLLTADTEDRTERTPK